MTTSFIEALTKELDSHTPCLLEKGNVDHRKINRRLLFLVTTIVTSGEKHFSKRQFNTLVFVLRFAAKKHEGFYRKDKTTPYLHHPLEVAVILIDLGISDFKLIVSAILHDVPEDTSRNAEELCESLKEIATLFGHGVRNIVGLVTVPHDSLSNQNYISFVRKGMNAFFGQQGDAFVNTMITDPLVLLKKEPTG